MNKSACIGVGIGGSDSEDECCPKKTNTVEIYANLDAEESKINEMGTSYDPPRERDINVPNEDLLKIIEQELNIKNTQNPQMVETREQEGKKIVDTWKYNPKKRPDQEIKHNAQFEKYYKHMGIIKESEWNAFYNILKEPLDICFRINSVEYQFFVHLTYKHSESFEKVKQEIESKIQSLSKIPDLQTKIPVSLKWYPSQLAYSFNELARTEMRRNPLLKDFHQFLIQETEMGRILRQEAVSMIPVTLLNIEPHHSVIDMCAAPGSKTIQILEYLHANKQAIPKGFVIANDTDVKRAYMLTFQARRLNSPALFVSNNDVTKFPNLKIDQHNNNMKYDRILCDVPCSGDGTLRKNLGLWKTFHPHMGHKMHSLQLQILEKGFSMLKKGGRLVYSTCSFNPIENEAVVAAALSRYLKQIELVDISQEVSPHLKYRPGMTSWKVYHRGKGKIKESLYTNYSQVQEHQKKAIKESMFTDTYTMFNNEEDRPEGLKDDPLNLKRCLRIFPHDANQGGFFVAVFTKILDNHEGFIYDDMYQMNAWDDPRVKQKPILNDLKDFVEEFETMLQDHEQKNNVPKEQSSQNEFRSIVDSAIAEKKSIKDESGVVCGKMAERNDDKEKSFSYVKLLDHKPELWENIAKFYGISEDFPKHLLYFQQDTSKKIVLVSEGIDQLMSYKRKYKMNVVIIGVKIFAKNRDDKSKAKYRIMSDGLKLLLPYMNIERKINVEKEFFVKMLHKTSMTYDQLKNEHKIGDFENKEHGTAVMIYQDFAAVIWIGKNNVTLMINKEEINSTKFLLN